MSDDFKPLVLVDSETQIQVHNVAKTPFASAEKKDQVHVPAVKGSYVRMFPAFYKLNNAAEIDMKTKKTIKPRSSFTRIYHPAGSEATEIVTVNEVYFIPLAFKTARMLYLGEYNKEEKSAPDCQSDNGIVPQTNKIASSCDACPHSKWAGNVPPKCGEQPVILALDMTGNKIEDPELKQQVSREAVMIQLKKSAIKPVRELMKKLAEPYPFEDGSFGQVDMTRFLIKMTAEVAIVDGREAAYSVPSFEIVGYVPADVSEGMLEQLQKQIPTAGNKTVLEIFNGRTEPFESVEPTDVKEEPKAELKSASPPPAKVAILDVKAEEPTDVPDAPVSATPVQTEEFVW